MRLDELSIWIRRWMMETTDVRVHRWQNLIQAKERNVTGFFKFVSQPLGAITPHDVEAWVTAMKYEGISYPTIYTRFSHLRSFLDWLLTQGNLDGLTSNPARAVNVPYQPEEKDSTSSLTQAQVATLLNHLAREARTEDLRVKRDYAFLLFYLAGDLGQTELLNLRWGDVRLEAKSLIITRSHGRYGQAGTLEIQDEVTIRALLNYLSAGERLHQMKPESVLWTRTDWAGKAGEPLTAQAITNNLRQYLQATGLPRATLAEIRKAFQGLNQPAGEEM